MSTSSDFSWAAGGREVFSFEYPTITGSLAKFAGNASAKAVQSDAAQREGEWQKRIEKARMEGERDGEIRARKIFEEHLAAEREQIRGTLLQFQEERQAYFRRVEAEVVQLSLAIARKVLHREAQVDKGLIAGFVRSSIGQLAEGTAVFLRVHPSVSAEWKMLLENAELAPQPEVVADAAVAPNACVVSSQLGSTEISVESQLKEIEQGLFDLIAKRP